jgi:hypothetical protein
VLPMWVPPVFFVVVPVEPPPFPPVGPVVAPPVALAPEPVDPPLLAPPLPVLTLPPIPFSGDEVLFPQPCHPTKVVNSSAQRIRVCCDMCQIFSTIVLL